MPKAKFSFKDVPKVNPDDEIDEKNTPKIAMPMDITGGTKLIQDYREIPCTQICHYRKKDPYDIVNKEDPEYQALVVSISEKGVHEAIIVRSIKEESLEKTGIKFEVLSGHHRLEASIDADKKTIPAKVLLDCNDSDAEDIYRITNLLRKKQTIRDLAYGWWHYFRTARYHSDKEIDELVSRGELSQSFKVMKESKQNRQLYRYARLHELTDEMFELVEKKMMSIKFGVEISYIDKHLQNDLLEYKSSLKSLEKARQLRQLAEGEEWNKKAIEQILFPNQLPSVEDKKKQSDSEFIKSLQECIPASYHEREPMLALIQEAISFYIDAHPEIINQPT